MLYGTIQRWGNSQGIRIPKGALAASHIGENDAVEIIAEKNTITLRKVNRPKSLDERTKTTGEILCEHVKSLDLQARGAVYVESLPDDLLQEALTRVKLSIE